MRICIFGAGAVGSHFAVRLALAGHEVSCVMRGPHLALHEKVFGSSEAGWREVSPMHRLRGEPTPMLLVHSSRRPLAGEQARRFAAAVGAIGGHAEVLSLDLSHADLNDGLGREPDYTARVDAFIGAIVAGPPASTAA